ncbi:UNKNOWN [Stylonychia lemnae]|uniref:Uncharacterized protein n=1 Tax=Stylonychia lemnae TaxID=5949 RepID=A0A078BAF1_STYLE|nr:UNKNOWN [Stylonychia lemnae]|eukprot:CDW91369.1 UNKNOWN [Stylonychia lemnae]
MKHILMLALMLQNLNIFSQSLPHDSPSEYGDTQLLTIIDTPNDQNIKFENQESKARITQENLSMYVYPDGESSTDKIIADVLLGAPISPKNLIVKVVGHQEPNPIKSVLMEGLSKLLKQPDFKYIASIHTSNNIVLKNDDANIIFGNLKKCQDIHKQSGIHWSSVQIDAEPVFDSSSGLNNVDFLIYLGNLINNQLRLPFTIYFSPAKFGNKQNGIYVKDNASFNRVMKFIKAFSGNQIWLPSYSYADDPVKIDDIEDSVKILKSANASYQLILDTKDPPKLKNRIQDIKTKGLNSAEGLSIFSVSKNGNENLNQSLSYIAQIDD